MSAEQMKRLEAQALSESELSAIRWAINDQIDGGHAEHPTVAGVIRDLQGILNRYSEVKAT